jgi:hypothetical protein
MEVFLVGTAGHECVDQVSLFLEHSSFSSEFSKI